MPVNAGNHPGAEERKSEQRAEPLRAARLFEYAAETGEKQRTVAIVIVDSARLMKRNR